MMQATSSLKLPQKEEVLAVKQEIKNMTTPHLDVEVSAGCANNLFAAPLIQALPTNSTAGSTKLATVLNQ